MCVMYIIFTWVFHHLFNLKLRNYFFGCLGMLVFFIMWFFMLISSLYCFLPLIFSWASSGLAEKVCLDFYTDVVKNLNKRFYYYVCVVSFRNVIPSIPTRETILCLLWVLPYLQFYQGIFLNPNAFPLNMKILVAKDREVFFIFCSTHPQGQTSQDLLDHTHTTQPTYAFPNLQQVWEGCQVSVLAEVPIWRQRHAGILKTV